MIYNQSLYFIGVDGSLFAIDDLAAGFYKNSIGQCALPFGIYGFNEFVFIV